MLYQLRDKGSEVVRPRRRVKPRDMRSAPKDESPAKVKPPKNLKDDDDDDICETSWVKKWRLQFLLTIQLVRTIIALLVQ